MNKEDFTGIYKKYYPFLFRYILRLCKNEDVTKDICQETFLKLYNQTLKGKEIEFVKSWVFKCANNDYLNRIKRNQIISFESTSKHSETPDPQNPEEKYIKTEKQKEIEKAIKQLSETEKQLILLYQDDFSYAEMAEVTGIKRTSVGKTLSRTIKKVCTHLHKTKSYEML